MKLQRTKRPVEPPPILADELLATLRQNTLDFLDKRNLKRIRSYGGRPKRGLLFSGPPGNGKTSACRWIMQHCGSHGHETRQVTPDDYQAARRSCNPAAAVRELFKVDRRGVIFFDDMDLALRDRVGVDQPEDQAVFIGAMDGIEANEGVVYVFTTNLPLNRIDSAFRRPGRLDVTLNFPKPDAALRRRLVDRWHEEIRAALDLDQVVRDTDGQSFAEVEELKNLLVLRFVDANEWNWIWAKDQFERNRREAMKERNHKIGFAANSLTSLVASSV
jgi:SpoVK/Ycf46/Vps4 family AAA+-type ATPase